MPFANAQRVTAQLANDPTRSCGLIEGILQQSELDAVEAALCPPLSKEEQGAILSGIAAKAAWLQDAKLDAAIATAIDEAAAIEAVGP